MDKLQQNEDDKPQTRADDRSIHANPQEIRLHLIVDKMVELLVRQTREHVAHDDGDEILRGERAARS